MAQPFIPAKDLFRIICKSAPQSGSPYTTTEDGGQTHGETLLCPVRTLRAYIEMTAGFRQSDSMFVCHTGHRRSHALSKRLSNWTAETICYAYTSSGHPVPPRIRGHSTWGGGGGGGGSDIVGSLAGCPTLRHLCCGLMGLVLHICKILQAQCVHRLTYNPPATAILSSLS